MKILQRKNGSWQLWYVDKHGKRKAVTLKVDGRNPKNEREAEKARDAVLPSLFLDKPPKYSTVQHAPKKKHEIISRQPYTREEIDDILQKLDAGAIVVPCRYKSHGKVVTAGRTVTIRYKDEMRLAILLGAYCGLRLKDAVSIRKEQFIDGNIVLKPAKTKHTTGVEVTVPVLHEDLKRALENSDGWLTPNLKALHDKSDAICARRFSDFFRWCGYKTQLECDDRPNASIGGFHALRHSFVTWCGEAGVPIEIVQTVVGHTSRVTTRIYNHISAKRKAMELQKIMSCKTDGVDLKKNYA